MLEHLMSAPPQSWATWVRIGVLLLFLIAVSITDIYTEKAPNKITLPVTGFGLIFGVVAGIVHYHETSGLFLAGLIGLGESALGFLVGFLPLFIIFMLRGIRGGDVKTMGAVGAVTGSIPAVFHTMFWGIIVAAIMAIVMIIFKKEFKRTFKTIFVTLIMFGSGRRPDVDDSNTTRVPYAVAFLFGAVIGAIPFMLSVKLPWLPAT